MNPAESENSKRSFPFRNRNGIEVVGSGTVDRALMAVIVVLEVVVAGGCIHTHRVACEAVAQVLLAGCVFFAEPVAALHIPQQYLETVFVVGFAECPRLIVVGAH